MITTTNKGKIESGIKRILDEKGYSIDDLNLDSTFKEDMGLDSLDVIELIMEVERVFSITIPDEEADGLTTLGGLVDYVDNKIEERRDS